MAGLFDFNANDPQGYNQLQLRQRIALAMMANSRKGYPKNIGEGITALGDAFGERGQIAALERMQAAEDAAGDRTVAKTRTGDASDAAAPQPQRTASLDPQPDTSAEPTAPTIASALPPQVSPMQQQAALTPTQMPPSFFPSDPSRASSAGPEQLALSPPPTPNAMALRSPIAAVNTSIAGYNLMPPQLPPGPRSDVAEQPPPGPFNPAQASQMSTLASAPPGPQASPYGVTASLDGGPVALSPRDGIARALQARQAGPGVPQPNPTLAAAGSVPAALSLNSATAGPPPEVAGNPEIPFEPYRVAQAGTRAAPPPPQLPPIDVMPPGLKPTGAPQEPVPPAPSAGRVPIDAGSPKGPQVGTLRTLPPLPPAPKMPDESPVLQRARDAILYEKNPGTLKRLEDVVKFEEQKRKELYDKQINDWNILKSERETASAAERERARTQSQTELTLQAAEDARRARDVEEKKAVRLGRIPENVWTEDLKNRRADIANLPIATDSIKRATAVLDKMRHGPTVPTEMFLSQMMEKAGWPRNPADTATQQFQTAMSGMMAQARKSIVGPGAQSLPELELLKASTAADARLDPDTIRKTLEAAASLNLKIAINHQQQVRQFAGEDEPDRAQKVFSAFGVPRDTLIDMVPQSAVNKLFEASDNPDAHKFFNDKFHTPGLAADVLRYRRRQ